MKQQAFKVGELLESFVVKKKDIVLTLDYSQSMSEGGRITTAVTNILKIFDNFIKSDDRVAFIRFNMNCDLVFSLMEKSRNTVQLRR